MQDLQTSLNARSFAFFYTKVNELMRANIKPFYSIAFPLKRHWQLPHIIRDVDQSNIVLQLRSLKASSHVCRHLVGYGLLHQMLRGLILDIGLHIANLRDCSEHIADNCSFDGCWKADFASIILNYSCGKISSIDLVVVLFLHDMSYITCSLSLRHESVAHYPVTTLRYAPVSVTRTTEVVRN